MKKVAKDLTLIAIVISFSFQLQHLPVVAASKTPLSTTLPRSSLSLSLDQEVFDRSPPVMENSAK